MTRVQHAGQEITSWPASAGQLALRDAAQEFLAVHGDEALRRDGGPEHFTASCVVFDLEKRQVLLNHHRKAAAWGQFGGHIEDADPSLRAAAHRECAEESGLPSVGWFSVAPIDLHVHPLSAAFGSCRVHRDVVFAAAAPAGAPAVASAESIDVAWFDLTALPAGIMPDLPARLPALFAAAQRAHAATGGE